jgi:ABC-type bacteriocin/lantibiotic exporter with double-glycine peptidase domain
MPRVSRWKRPLLLLAIPLIVGCASVASLPKASGAFRVLNVPFFPGVNQRCGPASLASVMNYWKVPVTVDEVTRDVFNADLRGSLLFDLAHFPRKRGLEATEYFGSPEDLRDNLRRGHPLITFLNFGNSLFPAGHFVVVIGYTEDGNWLIAHSGGERGKRIPYDRFVAAWAKMDYWTLLILPNGGTTGEGFAR